MSDKSFEQQVREELSDLRMKPNAAVWESVAASIKKERKRRRVLWIFFLLAGLSGTAFWWYIKESSGTQELSNTSLSNNNTGALIQAKPLPLQEDVKPGKAVTATKERETDKEQAPSGKKSTTIVYANSGLKPATVYQPLSRNTNTSLTKKENLLVQTDRENEKKSEKDILSSDPIVKKETDEKVALQVNAEDKKVVHTDTSSLTVIADSKKDTGNLIKETAPVTTVQPDSVKTDKKIAKTNTWQWRIAFSAGSSGIRNSIRSLLEPTNSRAYDNAYFGTSAPIGGGTNGQTSQKPVVRDAFSFGSSIELVKKMGKKEQHALGLSAGYYLYTTTTGVGSLNTGTVQFNNVNAFNDANKYYAIKDSASYTAYYHFIQLGLRYYHSLKWFRKIDLQWYGGIGINALLGSNGLHLGSTSSGAYLFQNRSLLRSFQMDISGGLDIGLGKAKQVYLGPQFQYMLSNLSKQPGVNQHLFRPSVRLSFLLNKRK